MSCLLKYCNCTCWIIELGLGFITTVWSFHCYCNLKKYYFLTKISVTIKIKSTYFISLITIQLLWCFVCCTQVSWSFGDSWYQLEILKSNSSLDLLAKVVMLGIVILMQIFQLLYSSEWGHFKEKGETAYKDKWEIQQAPSAELSALKWSLKPEVMSLIHTAHVMPDFHFASPNSCTQNFCQQRHIVIMLCLNNKVLWNHVSLQTFPLSAPPHLIQMNGSLSGWVASGSFESGVLELGNMQGWESPECLIRE